MSYDKLRELQRRRFLASLGIGVTAGMAGCLGDDDDGVPADDSDDTDDTAVADDTDDTDDDDDFEPDRLPEPSGSYDIAHHAQYTTLNPIFNSEANASTAIGRTLHEGYTFDENSELFPLVYKDIWSDEGQVWVIELRDHLEFSDPYGQVTAEDFVYMIQEVHQNDVFPSANSSDWAGVEVEQTGELEFQAEIASADPLWHRTYDPLDYPIPKGILEPYVQEDDVEGMEQDDELIDLTFTGNLGPYVMDNWERGSGTTYTRNDEFYLRDIDDGPEFFENAPYFEEASIQLIEEQAGRIAALQTNQVDNAGLPPERVQEFEDDDDFDVYSVPSPYNNVFHMNLRDNGWNAGPGNLFRPKKFRQAMTAAVDKQAEIEGIFFGRAEPQFTWQPQWSAFYPDDASEVPEFGWGDMYGEEVAKGLAEEALEDFEYDYYYGDDGMLKTPDGDTVELEFLHSDTSPTVRQRAEFYASELSENLGMDVSVSTVEGTYFQNNMFTGDPLPPVDPEEGPTEDHIDIVNGEEVVWEQPAFFNPGPRHVTSNDDWDMALVYGLNSYPLHPLPNSAFLEGATAGFNAVGWYPDGWDPKQYFDQMREATTEEEVKEAFGELLVQVAYDPPGHIMTTFTDDIEGYQAGLWGPIDNFHNGWDFSAWHYPE